MTVKVRPKGLCLASIDLNIINDFCELIQKRYDRRFHDVVEFLDLICRAEKVSPSVRISA